MSDLREVYRRYLSCCNKRRFEALGEFVRPDVLVDDERLGLEGYASRLRAVVVAFPDYRWEIEHLVVEGDSLAARLRDSGTHTGSWLGVAPTGRRVETQERAFYRFEGGRIAQVWARADDLDVLRQLTR